jgi:drug/metabolite transporter (DMT)-like permease
MKPSYLILLLLMNLIWSGVYSAYKIIGAEGLSPGGIVTIRFGLAGLCLLAVWRWLPGRAPRGFDLLITCVMGVVLYVVGQRLQVLGNHLGSAGNSSILMGIEPLITSVAAGLFLREHIGPRRMGGFALGLVGIGLLNGVWREDFHWTSLSASLIFISSFVCEAAYSVLGKPIVGRASIMKMLAISLLIGLALNLLIDGRQTFLAAQGLSLSSWGLLLGLAIVCTALGYGLWFLIIRDCPVNLAALTVFSQAVFGVIIAWIWLGETIHGGQLLGAVIIVAGLALGFSRQIQKPADVPHPAPKPAPAPVETC